MNEQLNETLMSWVTLLNTPLWDFLVIFLVFVGVFYTLITGAVQIRLFWHSIKAMRSSRKKGEDSYGITPFQALVTGLASRVGAVTLPVLRLRLRLVVRVRCSGCGLPHF